MLGCWYPGCAIAGSQLTWETRQHVHSNRTGEENDSPWLHLRLQLTYPAHPDMLSAHGKEGYEAELEPGARLSSKHGGC